MTPEGDQANVQGTNTPAAYDEADRTAPQPVPSEAEDVSEASRIEQIRNILFGVQMHDYDDRFSRLEAQVRQASEELRKAFSQRCDDLEHRVQHALESFKTQLIAEQEARTAAVQTLVREVQSLGTSLELKTAQLTQHVDAADQELQQSLLQQAKCLSDEMQQKYTDLSALLDSELQEVRHAKMDRTALADLLGEVASRLKA
jgi:hypothetical protein